MTRNRAIATGRHPIGRVESKNNRCESCNVRLQYGEPNPNGYWHPKLRLTVDQVDLLLIAAAEFDSVSAEDEDRNPTTVEFTDWIRQYVTGKPYPVPGPDMAGRFVMEGRRGLVKTTRHAQPDPLPRVTLPPRVRRAVA